MLMYPFQKDHSGSNTRESTSGEQEDGRGGVHIRGRKFTEEAVAVVQVGEDGGLLYRCE